MVDYNTPTAYWKLNEANGNALDSSGNGYTLTNNGTTPFAAGKLNNCADFTDNSTYFTSAETVAWNFGTGDFTVAFWIKKTDTGNIAIVGTDDAWLRPGRWRTIVYGHKAYMGFAAGGDLQSATSIDDNAWHRVVYSKTGTGANEFKVYIDGNMDAQTTSSCNCNDALGLYFNRDSWLTYPGTNQYVDDLRIYKGYGWTQADVTDDWNSGTGKELSSGPDFTKLQINISDVWKACAGMQIQIGGNWKQVAGLKVNISDDWKTIF